MSSLKKWAATKVLNEIKGVTCSTYWCADDQLLSNVRSSDPDIPVHRLTRLCRLMNGYGSDKANGWHNYTKVYHQLMEGRPVRNLFEMGIGTTNVNFQYNMGTNGAPGASLYAWRDYFPEATIVASDIDTDVLIQDTRINSYQCDQTCPDSIALMWAQKGIPQEFDVMIDDGLHEFDANCILFENSIHKLCKGGIYVVEDVKTMELGEWKRKIESVYMNNYPDLVFRTCIVPNHLNARDNNLVIVYST